MITATNIGKNCNIISNSNQLIFMNSHDLSVIEKQIEEVSNLEKPEEYSVVLTGVVLSMILNTKQGKQLFKALLKVHSIVCCRVTPKQKVSHLLFYLMRSHF